MALYTSECSKRPSSKAAASEGARRTFRYVEPLSDARTPLEDFFSILLKREKYSFKNRPTISPPPPCSNSPCVEPSVTATVIQ